MPASDHATEDDPGLFADDENASATGGASADAPPPRRILIVVDEVDVHVVTKFALSNANFQSRRLSFVQAYSAKEALGKHVPDHGRLAGGKSSSGNIGQRHSGGSDITVHLYSYAAQEENRHCAQMALCATTNPAVQRRRHLQWTA